MKAIFCDPQGRWKGAPCEGKKDSMLFVLSMDTVKESKPLQTVPENLQIL